MLDDGRMWRLQLDTYEREIERYGGASGIELAEQLFCADSACVVDIVGMLDGDAGADARWRLALRGIDQLLDDLGFDLAQRLAVMQRSPRLRSPASTASTARSASSAASATSTARSASPSRACSIAPATPTATCRPASSGWPRARLANAPIVAELRAAEQRGALTVSLAELAPSYIHMHVNRLIRSAQRAHELVLYDLLVRLYESRVARAKQKR